MIKHSLCYDKILIIIYFISLQGSCNHIAALMYRVEYSIRTGLTKATCTSVLSTWVKPSSFKPSKPIKLNEQLWKRDTYFKHGNYFKHILSISTANNSVPTHSFPLLCQKVKGHCWHQTSPLIDLYVENLPGYCRQYHKMVNIEPVWILG